MKNLLLLFFSLFLFFGCKETTNNKQDNIINGNNSIQTENNPLDSVGIIHNELLDFYHNRNLPHDSSHFNRFTYNNTKYLRKSEFDDMVNSCVAYGISKGWNLNTISIDTGKVYSLFRNANMFENINGTMVVKDISTNLSNLLQSSLNLGFLTNNEYQIILPILNAYNAKNYSLCDSLINNLSLDTYNSNTQPSIFIFKSVYNHSTQYWNNFYSLTDITSVIKNGNNKQDKTLNTPKDIFVSGVDALVSYLS
jgi:hypothetical protein